MVAVMLVRPVSVSPSVVLTALVLALLAANSCVAVRRARARGDHAAAAFVAAATLLLAVLFATVRAHERLAGGDGDGGGDADRRRRRCHQLKAAAWAVSAALTCMFARRVAAIAPAPWFAVLVWGMAAATVAGGFCCLCVLGEGHGGDGDDVLGGRRLDA